MEQPLARPRAPEIQDRHDVAGGDAAESARGAAHAHLHAGGDFPLQLDARRKLLQLERHTQAALHGFLAGDRHPQQQRQEQRQQLEPDVPERPDGLHVS